MPDPFLTPAQLQSELDRCLYCAEKPCQKACPVDCSPADFIMAARKGARSDFKRAASIIMGHNPLGGLCGVLCPDTFCVAACSRKLFDTPIRIPEIQAAIIHRAKNLDLMPRMEPKTQNRKRIAILGGGPAGLGAAAVMLQEGFEVVIFEKEPVLGGQTRLIPLHRLDSSVLDSDLAWISSLGRLSFRLKSLVPDLQFFENQHFDAVVQAEGPGNPLRLDVPGGDKATDCNTFLKSSVDLTGKKILVIGGGAVAVDCAVSAKKRGGDVEILYRRRIADMPLTAKERQELQKESIDILPKTRVTEINSAGVHTVRLLPMRGTDWTARRLMDEKGTEGFLPCDLVVLALGYGASNSGAPYSGAGTVVEAVASGKNAAAKVCASLLGMPFEPPPSPLKSTIILSGRNLQPIDLRCQFFGRSIRSPFLLSAAPHTDGYEQMVAAYEAGWAGGVMKTAFDANPVCDEKAAPGWTPDLAINPAIHIPDGYMFALSPSTYGNCDNVSAHPMDRICMEVSRLVSEWPDRLTLASTGGPVTGNDASDRAVWQSNTQKLEAAGAMGIEYSLSCPQGGDGARGDIVSQDPALTAKVVDWVMAVSNPEIPKLFKLTGAVTSIQVILAALQQVFERYPGKKAGVTLANSFPGMAFRSGQKTGWDEGIVVGLAGEGIRPISALSLAKASLMRLTICANGGAMNYRDAADFLALGAETVQFCTLVMKEGLHIIHELESGLSHLLEAKRINSVTALIGAALPQPITDFMDLPANKHVPQLDSSLCRLCGNCARCPYQAITLNGNHADSLLPSIDPEKCVGCSLCAQKCFAGALKMITHRGD